MYDEIRNNNLVHWQRGLRNRSHTRFLEENATLSSTTLVCEDKYLCRKVTIMFNRLTSAWVVFLMSCVLAPVALGIAFLINAGNDIMVFTLLYGTGWVAATTIVPSFVAILYLTVDQREKRRVAKANVSIPA